MLVFFISNFVEHFLQNTVYIYIIYLTYLKLRELDCRRLSFQLAFAFGHRDLHKGRIVGCLPSGLLTRATADTKWHCHGIAFYFNLFQLTSAILPGFSSVVQFVDRLCQGFRHHRSHCHVAVLHQVLPTRVLFRPTAFGHHS